MNNIIEPFDNNNYFNLENNINTLDNKESFINNEMLEQSCNLNKEKPDINKFNNEIYHNSFNINNEKLNTNEFNNEMLEKSYNSNTEEKVVHDNLNNNDILNILNDDNFYNPKIHSSIEHDNKNTIIKNSIIENNFIKKIIEKKILQKNKYPDFNDIVNLYYENYINNLNDFKFYKYIIYFFNIIYLLLLTYIFIGWLSPYNLLIYHILFSVLFLIFFENKNNDSPYTILIKLIFKKNLIFLPFNHELFKNIIILFILLSFIGLLNQNFSFFNIIKNILNNLSCYN